MANINNGIFRLSNSQKTLLIKLDDFINELTENVTDDKELVIELQLDNSLNLLYEFLYNYNFRMNGIKIVYKDENTSSYDIHSISITTQSNAILTLNIDDFDLETPMVIDICVIIGDDTTYTFNLYFTDNKLDLYKFYDKQTTMIASNMESFMLLRTNPKLTGNVKLVVTEDDNIFLDTFKVSTNSILNKQEYRRQAISSDGNYPHDVYKTFKYLPATEMYSIYPDSYDPHKNYHNFENQIENIYEYGAELNTDKLYSENMRILAPLYIGKHLPTYFAIWRSDRLYTKNNTDTNALVFNELLKDSKCIKIFDLRRSTVIGKYLHSYQEQITKYFAGTCALLFIEQDNNELSIDHRQGQNTWKGIAYDKGILTDRNETTYFATQTLNKDYLQENFNMFLLNGYSRNKLLYPNIINLLFMFNDTDAEDFSMHNYFGLYLTENDFIQFNEVIKQNNISDYSLTYFDSSNNIVNLNSTPINIIEDPNFTNRIFFGSTINSVANLTNIDDFTLFAKNEAANKPYENIVLINGNIVEFDLNDAVAFLSMDLTKQIYYGEHFKFIIPKYEVNNTQYQQVVFEVIASNDKLLVNTKNHISQYVLTNNTRRAIDDSLNDDTKIYRVAFYTQDINDETILAPIDEQIRRLGAAIDKFDNVIKTGSCGSESISILSSVKDVYFQHIMADEFNSEETINDSLRYYNYNNIQKCEFNHYNNDIYKLTHMPYANNGLEETLERYTNIVKFINTDIFRDKFIYQIDNDIYKETNKVAWPLIYTESGYYPMVLFKADNGDLCFVYDADGALLQKSQSTTMSLDNTMWLSIISPFDVDKSIICAPFEILYINDQINICSPLALNVAIMGINNIKDIDMYINLEETEEHYTSTYASFNAGETIPLDNSDPRLRRFITYSIISGTISGLPTSALNSFIILNDKIVYSDGNSSTITEYPLVTNYLTFTEDTILMLTSTNALDIYHYTTKHPLLYEDYYYTNPADTTQSNLNIPFVPLINCQWKSNGVYFDSQSLLDVDYLINQYNIVGNFIENQYTPGASREYIVDSLQDIIIYKGKTYTIYDYILKTGSIKKYICNNNHVQTAIGYYNPFVQTLEFIFYGIKFIFKLTSGEYSNEIKLNEFNNYEIFVINDYNGSNTNDIIVSKKEECILIINHVYKSSYYYENNNVKIFKNNIIQNVDYNWYDAPYNYNLKNTAYLNDYFYLNKSNTNPLYDIEHITNFIELDLDKYDSDFKSYNEKPSYAFFTIDSEFISNDYYDLYNNPTKVFTNKETNTTYGYDGFVNKYLGVNDDFRKKYAYIIKQNDTLPEEQISIKAGDKLNAYIESFNKDFNMYIINGEDSYKQIIINDNYRPLTVLMMLPNQVKYNNGLFDPNYVNIFNFDICDEISEKIGIDTLYGNTKLLNINSIINYYNNKIISENSVYTYNYFLENYRSPLSTNWDNNIYRQYTDENKFTYLPGYSLGIDDKTFFGSKVLNIHNDNISLLKWNYPDLIKINNASLNISKLNENAKPINVMEISLNLTKTFYNYIINLKSFINNWATLNNTLNIEIYINNYIGNTLYKLYNFKDGFDVILYKQYDSAIHNKSIEEHFVLELNSYDDYEVEQNFKTEFKEVNNEVILTITIQDYENYKFYPTVKINRI